MLIILRVHFSGFKSIHVVLSLQNFSHLPKLKLCIYSTITPIPLSLQPLATVFCINVTTLGTSYKWNHYTVLVSL